jgi:hypothetical protein
MKKLTLIAAVVSGIALCAATSQAQVVTTGAGQVATTVIYGGAAGVVHASQDPTFVQNIQTGDLLSQVYLAGSGLTDPAGYTGLTFAFQVHESGSDFIDHISVSGFNLSSVYIEYAGTGVAPTEAQLFNGVLTVDFSPSNVLSGQTSDLIYVFTTATAYAGNGATVDNSFSANTTDLAPVPEASTVMAGALMVLPLGIGAIRALRKERTA